MRWAGTSGPPSFPAYRCRVKRRVYIISGLCAAMAGLIIASELTSAAPQAGETFELNAIAAVVIGGAALMAAAEPSVGP